MGKVMEYNGYRATITYDADDEIFVGKVLGINDSLNFHGESVAELKETFCNCVDNYLEMCKEYGREPDKEYKGVFNVRIPPELHKELAVQAEESGITLNQLVTNMLENAVAPTLTQQAPTIYVIKTHEQTLMECIPSTIDYSQFGAAQKLNRKVEYTGVCLPC